MDKFFSHIRRIFPDVNVVNPVPSDIFNHISEHDTSPTIRSIQYDIDRIVSALSQISSYVHFWNIDAELKALQIRIKYGILGDLVPLCSLPGVGAKRARKLWNFGIKTVDDVLKNKNSVKQSLGVKNAEKVFTYLRKTGLE